MLEPKYLTQRQKIRNRHFFRNGEKKTLAYFIRQNKLTEINANVPNSPQVTTQFGQEEKQQNRHWVLRLGLFHPDRRKDESANWDLIPCMPGEIREHSTAS